jgi:hypothetical protein
MCATKPRAFSCDFFEWVPAAGSSSQPGEGTTNYPTHIYNLCVELNSRQHELWSITEAKETRDALIAAIDKFFANINGPHATTITLDQAELLWKVVNNFEIMLPGMKPLFLAIALHPAGLESLCYLSHLHY